MLLFLHVLANAQVPSPPPPLVAGWMLVAGGHQGCDNGHDIGMLDAAGNLRRFDIVTLSMCTSACMANSSCAMVEFGANSSGILFCVLWSGCCALHSGHPLPISQYVPSDNSCGFPIAISTPSTPPPSPPRRRARHRRHPPRHHQVRRRHSNSYPHPTSH